MKKIMLLYLFLLIFAGFSCKDKCKIDKPKNIKPIDWENYNDVHAVYGNYAGDCSEFILGRTGKIIKMYGWIFQPKEASPSLFRLLSDSTFAESNNPKCASVFIRLTNNKESAALRTKFDASDLTKKCYVTGELFIADRANNDCCRAEPEIFLESADDIYFE